MNNNQSFAIAAMSVVGVLLLAYVLANKGKEVELNALGLIKLRVS